MIPTNRQPPGLLSFFGVKNGGRNPSYGMDVLTAVCDLTKWMLADPLAGEQINNNVNVGAVGATGPALVVPAGQVWIVTDAVAYPAAVLAAATTFQGCLVKNLVSVFQWSCPIGPPTTVATTGQWFSAQRQAPEEPMFLRQGEALALLTLQLTGAAFSANVNARIARLTL